MNTIYTNHAVIEKPGDLVKALDEPTLANYERLKVYLRVYGYTLSDLNKKLLEVKKYTSLNHEYSVHTLSSLRQHIQDGHIGEDSVYQWHDILEVAEIMTLEATNGNKTGK